MNTVLINWLLILFAMYAVGDQGDDNDARAREFVREYEADVRP